MATGNWFHAAPGAALRLEAHFHGVAFARHRHDTYAIALTTEGVQSFTYRGETRNALPGDVVVLHPDEAHDGRAGDSRPFGYRVAYIPPADVDAALDGAPLPFLRDAVSTDPVLRRAAQALLSDCATPLDPSAYEDGLEQLALALVRLAHAPKRFTTPNRKAARVAREYIETQLSTPLRLADLERVTGHSRWQLSRDFRALLGVSPYRYWLCRRLDRVRQLLSEGDSLADIAAALGFADQSHMTRQFRQTTGVTPLAWRRLARAQSF